MAIGYDGTLYAGNTNFNYYAINPDGSLQWTYPTGSNAWSIAGIGDDGTLYWGSNDTFVHAVRPDGQVTATFRLEPGASYPLDAHRPGILLLDAEALEAVSLDYHANLSAAADAAGNAASVTLRIPAGTALPAALEAVVMADVFPLHRQTLAQP